VRLRGQHGERTLPLTEFFAPPDDARRTENVLGSDEIILSLHIPAVDATRSTYLKAMDRKTWAFALAGVAAVVRQSNGRIEDARIVLSGVAPLPWRARSAEQALIGTSGDDTAIERAADAALTDAKPLEHNGYKLPLTKSLIVNALRAVME
jgi:xanthine dehydrogenase YagS FAD-binding subunit